MNRLYFGATAFLSLFIASLAHAQTTPLVINVPLGGDIAAAVGQADTAGGGTINLAAGTYNLTSTIPILSNITINGQGSSTIIKGPQTPYTWPMITNASEGISNIVFSNFVLDGNIPLGAYLPTPSGMNNPYQTMGINFNAYTYPLTNVTIQNVEVRNTGEGMHLALVNNLTLNQVYAHDNVPGSFAHNVYLVDCNNVTILHSRFVDAHGGGDGLHFDFGGGTYLIEKSEFTGNGGFGILAQGPTSGATVQDSLMNFNGVDGWNNSVTDVLVQRSVASYNRNTGFYNAGGSGAYNYLFGVGDVNGFATLYGLGGYGVTDLDVVSSTTPNLYEAELADGVVGASDTAQWTTAYAGFSGLGAVDFNASHLTNGLLSFSHVGAVTAGKYPTTFRYSNGSGGTLSMPLTVNGVSAGTIAFPNTGAWTTWSTVNVTMTMQAGNNVVQINPAGSAAPEIDYFQVNTATPAAPAAPGGLTATALTPYSVSLNWNAVAGAATYNVYQNGLPVGANVTSTSYTDTRIYFGSSTLSYTVAAVNQGGASALSSAVSVTTPIDAPAGLQLTSASAGNTLTWMSANGASSYNVKRATVSGGPYTTIANVANTTNLTTTNFSQSYTDSTVTTGGIYYFYVVSAVGATAESANSYELGTAPNAKNPYFSLSAAPGVLSVPQGQSAVSSVVVTYANSYNSAVTLAVGGTPAGVTASLTAVNATLSTLTVTASSSAALGTFSLVLTGTSGSYSSTLNIPVSVVTPQQPQTITFNAIPPQTVGSTLTLSATASSGLPVSYIVVPNGNCSVAGSVVTFLNAGACGVIANQAGNSTYAAAPAVGQVITVNNPTPQTISFAAIGAQTVGTPLTLSAAATSGLAVTFASSTTSVCKVTGTTATFVAAGTCTITASQSGNGTYAAAPAVSRSFAVNPKAQTITFNPIAAQRVGTKLTVSATATSGLPVTFSVVANGNCSVAGSVVTLLHAGNCGVIANQAGNSSYAAAPAVGQIIAVVN